MGSLTVGFLYYEFTAGQAGVLVISFGADNAPSTVAGDWTLHYGSITADFSNGTYTSADGDWSWSLSNPPWSDGNTVTVALSGAAAPTVANAIPDQEATVGAPFSYTVPADTFDFIDTDVLEYTATDAADAALPSWLSFTASTRTFAGTPTTSGSVSVKVTATHHTNSVADTFTVRVMEPCPGSVPGRAFWSACLTVGQSAAELGYSSGHFGELSDTSAGSFTVFGLYYSPNAREISIAFPLNNAPTSAVAGDWTLHYDGDNTIDFSDHSFLGESGEDSTRVWHWDLNSAPWSLNEQVTVALSKPATPVQPDPDPDPNAAPTVTITAASTTVAPGGTVALTATAADSDGRITDYWWGARGPGSPHYSRTTGTFSTTSNAETTWTAPASLGEYSLRVRVRDNDGATASARVTITVDDAESVPALPAAGLALLAFVLAVRGARHVRTRAVPPAGSRHSANADRSRRAG